jgi:hypothetical protein
MQPGLSIPLLQANGCTPQNSEDTMSTHARLLKTAAAMLVLAFHPACGGTAASQSDGGSADAGRADAESADGAIPDSRSTHGGDRDGAGADAGLTDGAGADAGLTDGGLTDAGLTDGGLTDAGFTDGGGADVGRVDGGRTDGGGADGGPTDGGGADAGRTDGGGADGGRTDGGGVDGGSASVLPVNLGPAGSYVILAESGISTVPLSAVTGDLGVSPLAATAITGFSLTADSTNVFSTSTQVTGKVYAANYAVPTPANLIAAISAMQLAFSDAAGRAPGVTELGAGNIGGMTLAPGVYKWGTGLLIPSDVTLTGSATDVWIFQIAQDLTMSSGVRVSLAGNALPKNVFWQVAGLVDFGTTAHCEGVVLSQTGITLRTGASINGRLLAQTAVSLAGSTVVAPAP